MGTEIFQFQLLGPEKMRFKVSNPTSKSIIKSTFLWASLPWVYWEVKQALHLTIPLSQKKIIDDKKCFKNRIKKYSNGRQGCFNSKYLQRKLDLRKFDFIMPRRETSFYCKNQLMQTGAEVLVTFSTWQNYRTVTKPILMNFIRMTCYFAEICFKSLWHGK